MNIYYCFSYTTATELRDPIGQYIELYNNQRLHQSLGYKTPAELYCCQKNWFKKMEENFNIDFNKKISQ